MKLSILAASTSQTVNIFIQDSSNTTGAGLAGLAYNSAGLTGYYALSKAAAVSITLATLSAVTSAYSSGGFKEVDATNMPGWYRFDIPDAALASGRFVSIHLKGATNMAPLPIEIELTAWNNQDGVRGGMTALPNAAAEASGGLFTRGTGAGQINQDANGRADANVKTWIGGTIPAVNTTGVPLVDTKYITGTLQTARDIGASVLLSTGTGTGQLDFTSGVVKANTTQFAGQTVTAAAGVTLPSSVASPTNITAGTITTVTNLTNAPTAGDFTSTMKTSLNAAAPAVTVSDKTGFSLTAAYDLAKTASQAGDAMALTASYDFAKGTAAMTESYAADSATMTPIQALYQINQHLGESSISGTTKTVKKRDGSTTAKTFTLDSATTPTSITEST